MDVCCLKPFDFNNEYVFRPHHDLAVVGNIMKCPAGSELMKNCYNQALEGVDENNKDWHKPLKILNDNIVQLQLAKYIVELSNHDEWPEIRNMLTRNTEPNPAWYAIHWANENWRANNLSKEHFKRRSTIGQLMKKHGLYTEVGWKSRIAREISLTDFYSKFRKVKSILTS